MFLFDVIFEYYYDNGEVCVEFRERFIIIDGRFYCLVYGFLKDNRYILFN